jgi:hypothetical protein
MKKIESGPGPKIWISGFLTQLATQAQISVSGARNKLHKRLFPSNSEDVERGDVPGWVLVVLMTTGLVTAIWTIAAPRLTAILRNSLDSMNGIR